MTLDYMVNTENTFSIYTLWQSIVEESQRLIEFSLSNEASLLPFENGFQERWKNTDVKLQYFVWISLTLKEQRNLLFALSHDQQRQILLDISPIEREELFITMRPQDIIDLISDMTISEQSRVLLSLSETTKGSLLDLLPESDRRDILEFEEKTK